MARAYGTRPSLLLGVHDPLAAYGFDSAVFAIDEAVESAIAAERSRQDMDDLDGKARRKVRRNQERIGRVLDRVLGVEAERAALRATSLRLALTPARRREFVWNDERTEIVAVRDLD